MKMSFFRYPQKIPNYMPKSGLAVARSDQLYVAVFSVDGLKVNHADRVGKSEHTASQGVNFVLPWHNILLKGNKFCVYLHKSYKVVFSLLTLPVPFS
jgi:hypothetical protein